MPRSRATVSARAISFFAFCKPAVLSSSPVACWNRSPNSSRRAVWMCSSRSGSLRSRSSAASTLALLPRDELRLDRQLVPRAAHGLARERLRHAGEREPHPPGLDHRHPPFGPPATAPRSPATAPRSTATATRPAATATRPAATATRPAATATRPAATPAGTTAAVATAAAGTLGCLRGSLVHDRQVGAGVTLGHDLALIDPTLDADPAEGRTGLMEAVVD